MRDGPAPRTTALWFGAAGLLLSLVILGRRNLYEDEWLSLAYMQKPLGDLWRWTIACGCHPPGGLALDRLLLLAVGSARGIALVHALAWFGAVAFFVLSAQRLLRVGWGRAGFAALAFLHPQPLMWAGTIRWYAVWWGLALVVLAAGLLPRRDEHPPSWTVTVLLGLAAAVLLYLDYLAFIFLPCFAVAWLVRHGLSRPAMTRLLAVAGIGGGLAWPAVTWFLSQRALVQCHVEVGNYLGAAFHMAHGLSIGQAMMPWHPVGVIALAGLLLPCAWLAARELFHRWGTPGGCTPAARRELMAVVSFLALMVAGAIASGLGTKPRSFLGLVPLVGLLLALGAERVTSRPGRALFALVAALWIATGAYHLAVRTGTAKRQINDRPEEVIARLERLSGGEAALVLTTNQILTFEINARRARGKTALVVGSIWNDPIHGYAPGLPADVPRFPWVLVVEEAGAETMDRDGAASLAAARRLIRDPRTADLGRDPDWRWKSRLSGQRFEPYRFRVWFGRPESGGWREVRERFSSAAAGTILGEGE